MAGDHLLASKLCTKCKAVKSHSEFQPRSDRKMGLRSHCRRCRKDAQNAACRKWYRTNAKFVAAQKRRMLMWKYGITPEEYDALLTRQEGKCAICHQRPKVRKNLDIDHCHTTGAVRGLLCPQCNTGLGLFRDDLASLAAAIRYLTDAGSTQA